jgi:ADP-ribosyl-[dinitrogen reductase] hydrolase
VPISLNRQILLALFCELDGRSKVAGQELSEEIKDRIKGAIFGAACGSALGGSCVGLNHKEILATAGISVLRDFVPGLTRSRLPDHKPGELLSDAYLGLVLAESLIANHGKLDVEDLRLKYKELLESPEFAHAGADAHCLASLRRFVDRLDPATEGDEAVDVSGAARVFPVGCLRDNVVEKAKQQALLTNGDPAVAAASVVIADSINAFINGTRLNTEDEVRHYVHREMDLATGICQRFAEFWDDVAPDLDYESPASELPYSLVNVQSSVNECVPTSVGIFLIFRHDPEEAICAAARAGGDTDTAATIVGALAGAYHGASKLPERWIKNITNKDRLDKVVAGLTDLW